MHPHSSRRKPRDSSPSLSTSDGSPRLTPSTHSSRSPEREQGSIELQELSSHDKYNSKEENDEDDYVPPYARRASIDSAQSYELYTPDEDRAVLRRLDRKLVAFMALLYCLSFLDRSSKSSCQLDVREVTNTCSAYEQKSGMISNEKLIIVDRHRQCPHSRSG